MYIKNNVNNCFMCKWYYTNYIKKEEDITLITICYSNHRKILCAYSIVEVFIQEENQSPIVWTPCKRDRISGYCTSIVMVCITHNMLHKVYGCRIHILPIDIFFSTWGLLVHPHKRNFHTELLLFLIQEYQFRFFQY